jgi:hypothetical protein
MGIIALALAAFVAAGHTGLRRGCFRTAIRSRSGSSSRALRRSRSARAGGKKIQAMNEGK